MTFEEFQATRTKCDDLGAALSDARWELGPKGVGFLYLGCLYIEQNGDEYSLVLGNSEKVSADIAPLERDLYDWAMAEGYGE